MQCKIIWNVVTGTKLQLHEVAAKLATLGLETIGLSIEYESETLADSPVLDIKRRKSFEQITGTPKAILDLFQNDELKVLSIKEIIDLIPTIDRTKLRATCSKLAKRQFLKTVERGTYMLDITK